MFLTAEAPVLGWTYVVGAAVAAGALIVAGRSNASRQASIGAVGKDAKKRINVYPPIARLSRERMRCKERETTRTKNLIAAGRFWRFPRSVGSVISGS